MELTLEQALQKGIEAHKAGKVQEADRYYTAILKANPKHPDANHNMGVLAVGVSKVEQALPFFKTALDANPNIAQFWLSYIDALIKLERIADAKAVFDQAKSKGANGDGFDKLQSRLTNLTQIKDNQTDEEILKKAMGLREIGKYDVAIDLLLHQIKQSSKDPNVPALLSHIYILNDNLEQAKIHLDAAKNINPNTASVGWNEARLLLKHKKINEALAVAAKTNKLFPDDVEGMGVLGSCLRASGNVAKSLKHLNKAIELEPDYAEALINRGLIWLEQKDKVNALSDLEKAHHLKPHIKQIWHLVLNLKMEAKDFENTIALAKEMVKLDPVDEKNFTTIALCYQHLKNYDDAVDFYNKAISIKPDYAMAYNNMGNALIEQGKYVEAIQAYKKALAIKPDNAGYNNNLGSALKDQGKHEDAIEAYRKAIAIKPDFAEAYYNMANAFKDQGKLEEAMEAYNKAILIKADYAEAYNSLGNVAQGQGKLEKAIEAFKQAIFIKPDNALAYNNMSYVLIKQGKYEEAIDSITKAISIKGDVAEFYGNMGIALKEQGKLRQAVDSYTKALKLKPNYAEAFNNMGVILQEQGKLRQAIDSYTKAHKLKPNYAEVYWNLHGTAENISEAKQWIEKCLEANPEHLDAKLIESALLFYQGNKSDFNSLIKSPLKDHPFTRSFAWVFSLPKLPQLHFNRWALFDHITDLSKKDRPFYEFGVWRGEAFRYLIKTFKKGYGFDTFEGIPEDWHNEKAGTYSSDGNVPKIKGGKFIVGKFEDTLPGFFAEERPMASIINFDADLYSSTICALNFAKPVIDKDTILIFDEFITNEFWEEDEYKALEEFCVHNSYTYEVLAVSFYTKQVAVKIIGI